MKKLKFYVCSQCENILSGTRSAEISCCGSKLEALDAKAPNDIHTIKIAEIENDYYIASPHEMSKKHYISFVAFVDSDFVLIKKLYPEQNMELRIPKIAHGKLYVYCNTHGLFAYHLKGAIQ